MIEILELQRAFIEHKYIMTYRICGYKLFIIKLLHNS
jgi:hypothetical protein